MRTIITAILISFVGSTGCATDDANAPDKNEVQQGKADGADLCEWYGLDEGCDICREFGWYDDDVCDDFCDERDPDCGQPEPSIRFECIGASSFTMFDLEIVDEGDQEGTVIADDGGAPVTYSAHYDRHDDNDIENHTFIFGFDERNEGWIDELYEIEIRSVSYSFFSGTVDYDGLTDTIVCYDIETLDTDPSFDFDCLSIEDQSLYELTIVDIGDEEGTVVVDDGGAPQTYSAIYKDSLSDNGFDEHSFFFGFDDLDEGLIEELFAIEIVERGVSFATGLVDYWDDSTVVCYMP